MRQRFPVRISVAACEHVFEFSLCSRSYRCSAFYLDSGGMAVRIGPEFPGGIPGRLASVMHPRLGAAEESRR